MAEGLEFYQIFWKEEQKKQFFDWSIPYLNETLTPYFENDCIAKIVPISQAKRIAVVSHALKQKYRTMSVPPYHEITLERLETLDYDVYGLTKHGRLQSLGAMNGWHRAIGVPTDAPNCAGNVLRRICETIGVTYPREVKRPILQNAFCATSEVYKAYVMEALIPAIEVMESDPVIKKDCWQDSQYYKLKGQNPEFRNRVKQFLGTDFCPLHPFLLERLFSVWINDKGLKIITI